MAVLRSLPNRRDGARAAAADRHAHAGLEPRRCRSGGGASDDSCRLATARRWTPAIDDAFPGAASQSSYGDGWFEVEMQQHGLLRPLKAAELSDGTLRYLLWVAALLTPRPPGLLVLNEPETSLHPDLLPALGRLIAQTAAAIAGGGRFARPGAHRRLQQLPECHSITLEKRFGETALAGDAESRASWRWPAR